MDKVYIVTEAQIMKAETYKPGNVFTSAKKAEKAIREIYPNARKDDGIGSSVSFVCKDKDATKLMFIHEEEVH